MDPMHLCRSLLDELMNNPDAEPFMTPVPWKEWNLLDYPEIVKEPMDLTTIKQKMANNEYTDAYSFARDVRLIWSNCILYNPQGTEVRAVGEHFSALFEEKWKALLNKRNNYIITLFIVPENCKTPSLEKKTEFSNNFAHLTSDQIEHIVSVLQEKCPSALIEAGQGQLEISVDAISINTFYPLYQYQQDCLK